MKAIFKKIVREMLRFLAKKRLKKINPKVIGITGSVGKTGTKDLVSSILERRFLIHKSTEGQNSDIGTLLTILEKPTGYSSAIKWTGIIIESIMDYFRKPELYDVLVMEMGIDSRGGMDEILKVVTPDIMIFLNIKDVHRAEGQFQNREEILEEKSKACYKVSENGWVILNHDDIFVSQLENKVAAKVIKIGINEGADIMAKDISASKEGLKFTLVYEDKEIPVFLKNILGQCHIHSVLSAIAVGFIFGLSMKTIEAGLKDFVSPKGRMNQIDGKNGSLIIDSSYNASPETIEEALNVLNLFDGKKIAALGTMNELGELSESAHIKIGKYAAGIAETLVFVGHEAHNMAEGAFRAGASKSAIHLFNNSKEAGAFLSGIIEKDDVLLVKGSQNDVRMEHVVKYCMKEPEKAKNLLVRQDSYWSSNK